MYPWLSALAGDAEIEALFSDREQLNAMLAVENALAVASAESGWISHAAAASIRDAIARYSPDHVRLSQGMLQDGVVVPAMLQQLREVVEPAHRVALHRGATSQDIIDTALMLQLAKAFDVYEARLTGLLAECEALSRTAGGRPLMAHTRMQAALPTRWRNKIESWSEPLRRHRQALTSMRGALLVVQLGGPVGDRDSFEGHGGVIAAGMARQLDLGIASPWQATRDPIVALGSLLALISGSLGKFGADVALLAQTELGAVRIEGAGGSSSMAHKANPIAAEALVALARYNAGLSGTLGQAMVHEYERSGAAWTLEWLTLPPMLVTTGASLRLSLRLLEQLHLT